MKRILLITGIFGLAVLFSSAISIRETPQDPPRGKKTKRHYKMVKVDDDGKKTELDTVIEGDNVFIWNGDTIGGEHKLEWISEGDFDMDFDIDVEESADGKVIIMKSGKGGAPMIHRFNVDGDSTKIYKIKISSSDEHGNHNMMMFHGDEGDNEMIFRAPHVAGAPLPPEMMMMKMHKQGNVIDLSDPGIISYEKKDLKDGKEKITIVRKKPTEKDMEIHEEIIIHGGSTHPMMIHSGHPGKTKTIKVISGDDGNVEIIEDGKVMNYKKGSKDGEFITDDGKIVRIKKMKKGDGENVEIKVEVEEEKVEKEEK